MIDWGEKKALYVGITLQAISLFFLGAFLKVKSDTLEQALGSLEKAGVAAVVFLYING